MSAGFTWGDCTQCFYTPATADRAGSIVDYIHPVTGKSCINAETLEQIRLRYPLAEVWSIDAAIQHKEAALVGLPQPITPEDFTCALECLPPAGWRNHAGWEVFQSSELFSGRITRTYAKRGERAFSWLDVMGTPAGDIARKAAAAVGSLA